MTSFIVLLNLLFNPYWLQTFILYLLFQLLSAFFGFNQLKRDLQVVQKKGRAGYLYCFYDYGSIVPAIKIGRETHREQRLNSHRTAAPLGICVIFSFAVKDAIAAEAYLFKRYKPLRLYTRKEWFMLSAKLVFESLLMRKLK